MNMKKRGQVTVFIIIGIIIIAAGILIYSFYPQISIALGFGPENPSAFIQNCIEDEIVEKLEIVSLQGGSLSPEHYIMYDDSMTEYLCYQEEYYKTCVVQQPMLKSHLESEVEKGIKARTDVCFENLKQSYIKQGYGVELKQGSIDVELLPKEVITIFNHSLVLTKNGVEAYNSFEVSVQNNLYELVSVANSILDWESRLGDAETTLYMNYYHNLKVEKKKQTDGSTIYILTNRDTENKFQFASRSIAWPPGYVL